MRILPLLIIFYALYLLKPVQDSPHGKTLKVSCSTCHSAKGWTIDKEIYSFNHDKTSLPLAGQHKIVDCKACHSTLVFSDAKTECFQCHTDVHQSTVGVDCSRCHTPSSWLVNNINEIHQTGRFPLLGAHRTADCYDCHKSESLTRFDVLGVNCIDCHRPDYQATTNPKHAEAGFSQDCSICHPVNSFQWAGAGFNHNFFALVQGHSTPVCADCHTTEPYSDASPVCNSCHQQDYGATTNPNHTTSNFPLTCENCHTLSPDWKPASYAAHDAKSFPIYSGKHRGEWNSCTECHTNASNYAQFTCLSCHEHNKTDMDNKHQGENGYAYDSASCLRCHPTGKAD